MKKENVEKDVQKLKEEKKAQKAEKKRLKKEQKQLNKATTSSDSKIIAGIIIFVLVIAFGIFGFYCYKANTFCAP